MNKREEGAIKKRAEITKERELQAQKKILDGPWPKEVKRK